MAGLIAARMLHEMEPEVMERSSELPNNHSAVLRFRSSVVGDATNIPFKQVKVVKAVTGGSNRIADAVNYSVKATGKIHRRSILDLEDSVRYVCPQNFISRLASTASINYGVDFHDWSSNLIKEDCPPVISTLPIPLMMRLFDWDDIPEFNSLPGTTIRTKIKTDLDCSMHATLYCPSGNDLWYRATICDSDVIVECMDGNLDFEFVMKEACRSLGLRQSELDIASMTVHRSPFQKMSDLDEQGNLSVKRFIMWLSGERNIYSLGRMATWRPKLLLDDVVNDVHVIRRMMDGETNYKTLIKETGQ